MSSRIVPILLLCGLIAGLAGCMAVPDRPAVVDRIEDLPVIRDRYAGRLSRIFVGMSRESVLEVFPEAEPVAARDGIDAWEIAMIQTYVLRNDSGSNLAYGQGLEGARVRFDRQALWLYFRDGRLAAWDDPQTWPADGDVKVHGWE